MQELDLASRRLKASREGILEALQGKLTERCVFVLTELMVYIEELEFCIARFDAYLLENLADEHNTLALLQTLPGVDLIGAAMLLVEIGKDMAVFGHTDRLAAWVGLCPGNNESAGKHKLGHTRKGNPLVTYSVNSPTQPARPAAPYSRSSRPWSCAEVVSARSSPWRTKSCGRSSSCARGANTTGIPRPITKPSASNAMRRAGSRP